MPRSPRNTFFVGTAFALVALVASACVGLMTQKPAPASAGTEAAPEPTLSEIYRPARLAGEPDIRVRIAQDVSAAVIAGPDSVTLTPPGENPELMILRTPVEVRRSALGWSVTSEGDTRKLPDGVGNALSAALVIKPLGEDLLTLDGSPLPGWFALHAPERRSEFDVVEHVNIEAYLPGVVSKELYKSWLPETFRAQSIAARSYALHERARRRALGSYFDVVSTTRDQAYAGATNHRTSHDAVRDTAGLVLTWQGSILRAYYSSTTGGRAASAADTWPVGPGFEFNFAAPIQASPRGDQDSISPRFRWETTRSVRDVSARIAAYAKDRSPSLAKLGTVRSIEVIERNDFDRPVRFRITDREGKTADVRAEYLRVALNTSAPGFPAIDAKTRVYSSDMSVVFSGANATISGRGFGHGVGMSQFGAEAFARNGREAEDILLYYYPGAKVERAY